MSLQPVAIWMQVLLARLHPKVAFEGCGCVLATGPLTKSFFDQASEPKSFVEVPGASHVDLYDKDEFVALAVDAIDRNRLAGRTDAVGPR